MWTTISIPVQPRTDTHSEKTILSDTLTLTDARYASLASRASRNPFCRGFKIQGRFRTCLTQTGPKPTLNCWKPVFDTNIIILGPPPETTLDFMVSPRARRNIHSNSWCPAEQKNRPTGGKILEETPRPRTGCTPHPPPSPNSHLLIKFPPFNIIKRVLGSIASPIFSHFLRG